MTVPIQISELAGAEDIRRYAVPANWDTNILTAYELADGTTFDALLNDVSTAIALQNQAMFNDPTIGGMIQLTDELGFEYENGSTAEMERRSEKVQPNSSRGATTGHMLPITDWDKGLEWTGDFLEEARMTAVDSSVSKALKAVKNRLERDILTRFFTDTENVLGTSGRDMPVVNGSGGGENYRPPDYNGQSFTSSHTHFDRKTDDAAGRAAAIDAGFTHLWEHGIMPPYDLVIPFVDRADFTALASTSPQVTFVRPDMNIQYLVEASSPDALRSMTLPNEMFIGFVHTDMGTGRVWMSTRVPANYLGIYKSYGINAPDNPVVVRFDPRRGAGAFLVGGNNFVLYPFEKAIIRMKFGVGINSGRLNGYLCHFAGAGNYVNPTIA